MLIIRITTPRMPNSVPPKGRKANIPPTPNVLNNPKAQEGQAGARIAIIMPGSPTEALMVHWRRIRKMLIARTIPPNKERILSRMNADTVRLSINPIISEKSKEKEKLCHNKL